MEPPIFPFAGALEGGPLPTVWGNFIPVFEGAGDGPPNFLAGTFDIAPVGEDAGGPFAAFVGGPPLVGAFVGGVPVTFVGALAGPSAGAFVSALAPGTPWVGAFVGGVPAVFVGAVAGPFVGGGPPIDFLAGTFVGTVEVGTFFEGALVGVAVGTLAGIWDPGALAGAFATDFVEGAAGGEPGSFFAGPVFAGGAFVGGATGAADFLGGSFVGAFPGALVGACLVGGPPALNGDDFFTPPLVGGDGSFLAPVSFGFFKLKIRYSLCLEVGFSAWDILLDQVLQVVDFHCI